MLTHRAINLHFPMIKNVHHFLYVCFWSVWPLPIFNTFLVCCWGHSESWILTPYWICSFQIIFLQVVCCLYTLLFLILFVIMFCSCRFCMLRNYTEYFGSLTRHLSEEYIGFIFTLVIALIHTYICIYIISQLWRLSASHG